MSPMHALPVGLPHVPVVLVIEDDELVADAVAAGLTDEGMNVTVARDGRSGKNHLEGGGWNAVVLDLCLPGVDGMTLLGAVRQRDTLTPILLLTARDAVSDRVRGLRFGADDYLCKPFAFEELVARVRALIRRSMRSETGRITALDVVVDRLAHRAWRAGHELPLGNRAFALLVHFVGHPNRLFSKKELFEEVWHESFDPRSRTLDVHLVELRRQLELHGPPVIFTIRGSGYRFSQFPGDSCRR
jgi:DNA-binding response OmpR family regulator